MRSRHLPPPAWTPQAVRALRKRLDLSQTDFANLIGVRQGAVSRWETGAESPSRLARHKLNELEREMAA